MAATGQKVSYVRHRVLHHRRGETWTNRQTSDVKHRNAIHSLTASLPLRRPHGIAGRRQVGLNGEGPRPSASLTMSEAPMCGARGSTAPRYDQRYESYRESEVLSAGSTTRQAHVKGASDASTHYSVADEEDSIQRVVSAKNSSVLVIASLKVSLTPMKRLNTKADRWRRGCWRENQAVVGLKLLSVSSSHVGI